MNHLMAISQAKLGDGWTVEGLLVGVVILVGALWLTAWLLGRIFGRR